MRQADRDGGIAGSVPVGADGALLCGAARRSPICHATLPPRRSSVVATGRRSDRRSECPLEKKTPSVSTKRRPGHVTPRRNKKNGGDACSLGGARLTAAESAGACGTGRRRRRRRRPPRRWWATMTLLARTWAPPIGRSLRAANSRTCSAPTRQLKRTSCPTAQADAEHVKKKKNNTSFLSLMSPSRRGGRRERHTRRPRCDNSHRPPAAARCQLPAAPSHCRSPAEPCQPPAVLHGGELPVALRDG